MQPKKKVVLKEENVKLVLKTKPAVKKNKPVAQTKLTTKKATIKKTESPVVKTKTKRVKPVDLVTPDVKPKMKKPKTVKLVKVDTVDELIISPKVKQTPTHVLEEAVINHNFLSILKPRNNNTYKMSFGMAFVSEGNQQVASFVSCRDWMHDQVRTFINNKKRIKEDAHPYYPENGDPDLCMDKAKLLFSIYPDKFKAFTRGMTILNDFEKYANIEKSIAEVVTITETNDKDIMYILLTGNKCYMEVPHLLSLVTLVLRYTTMNPSFEYKSVPDLSKEFLRLKKDNKINQDQYLMSGSHRILHIVLKEREHLFKDKTPQELYPIGIAYSFHSMGGIHELCRCNSPNKDVNDKIAKILKDLDEQEAQAAINKKA